MSLRRRLLLSLLLTAVPLVAAAVWLRIQVDRWAGEQAFRDLVAARVEAWDRETCEADPGSPGLRRGRGQRRNDGPDDDPSGGRRDRRRRFPLRLFAYDREYRPADPAAPPFPPRLRAALEDGDSVASDEITAPDRLRHLVVGVRTGWDDGPCAVVLARGLQPLVGPPLSGLVAGAAALAGAFLVAVWVAAGPVVRRLRGLTSAVGEAAAAHYARPLEVAGRDEIAELARAFNDAAAQVRDHVARVEAREQTLRTFVANTTHDVMLPLTVLQGYLAALRQSTQEGKCHPDVVQSASEEVHYLASLVHNLGAAAKLEAGEPHVERHPVNLNELVERAAGRHRPIAGPRGIEVNTAVPERTLVTTGDVTLIEQAVSNVIHNAVRYNQPGGHVAVVLDSENGRFHLRVFDDGPGVPEELFGRLAEPRYRADDARTRSPGGQGLGLSIARQVADRHGFGMAIRRSEAGGLEVEFEGELQGGLRGRTRPRLLGPRTP